MRLPLWGLQPQKDLDTGKQFRVLGVPSRGLCARMFCQRLGHLSSKQARADRQVQRRQPRDTAAKATSPHLATVSRLAPLRITLGMLALERAAALHGALPSILRSRHAPPWSLLTRVLPVRSKSTVYQLCTGKNMRHEKKLVFDFVLVVRGYLASRSTF